MSLNSLDTQHTIEFTRAVCTCGKELSTIFYQLTAKNHFMKFATEIELAKEDIANMKFFQSLDSISGLNFCCLATLRYGIRESIAILPLPDQDSRKYPEGLPGPLSREKTLSWY